MVASCVSKNSLHAMVKNRWDNPCPRNLGAMLIPIIKVPLSISLSNLIRQAGLPLISPIKYIAFLSSILDFHHSLWVPNWIGSEEKEFRRVDSSFAHSCVILTSDSRARRTARYPFFL